MSEPGEQEETGKTSKGKTSTGKTLSSQRSTTSSSTRYALPKTLEKTLENPLERDLEKTIEKTIEKTLRKKGVRGRWTVIEEFAYDGFHYRVSRKPIESPTRGPQLTARERQALAYAHRGYNNKLIAKALGVAPSTVGVLLFRAATKVGAKSRRELLSVYARLERSEE